jgi:hypothetical protein
MRCNGGCSSICKLAELEQLASFARSRAGLQCCAFSGQPVPE